MRGKHRAHLVSHSAAFQAPGGRQDIVLQWSFGTEPPAKRKKNLSRFFTDFDTIIVTSLCSEWSEWSVAHQIFCFQKSSGCAAYAIMQHYLWLVVFAWMVVEAVQMYLKLVQVFGAHISHYMVKFNLAAWGKWYFVFLYIRDLWPCFSYSLTFKF